MLHRNMRCFLSELMLHTKIQYVRNYVKHENMISGVRTCDTYENVQCRFQFTFSEFGPRHSLGEDILYLAIPMYRFWQY